MDLHLKPCPHCGCEAKLNTITDDPERPDYQGNYIACEACGATTQLMFSTGEDCRPVLAELWNARHRQVVAYMATSRAGTVRFTDNPDAAKELEGYGWAITRLADAEA